MRAILINAPYARNRLKNISVWYGIDLPFDEVIDVTVPNVPMQAHPTSTSLTVLDMDFVNKYKKGFTVFVAPFDVPSKDSVGNVIQNRASVSGLYLPPLLPITRWEWWGTRLFWDSPAIQIFANENDQTWANGKALGPAFELWANHEFSHMLYQGIGKPDKTHEYFYAGEPEKARDEIASVLNPIIANTKSMPENKTLAERLVERATTALGTDISPADKAPDEFGCAETISNLIHQELPDFPIFLSTALLTEYLKIDKRFKGTYAHKPGTIIVSPRTAETSGHCGIFMDDVKIASNNSKTGLFEKNYTLDSWVDEFRLERGLKIYFFEPL